MTRLELTFRDADLDRSDEFTDGNSWVNSRSDTDLGSPLNAVNVYTPEGTISG